MGDDIISKAIVELGNNYFRTRDFITIEAIPNESNNIIELKTTDMINSKLFDCGLYYDNSSSCICQLNGEGYYEFFFYYITDLKNECNYLSTTLQKGISTKSKDNSINKFSPSFDIGDKITNQSINNIRGPVRIHNKGMFHLTTLNDSYESDAVRFEINSNGANVNVLEYEKSFITVKKY